MTVRAAYLSRVRLAAGRRGMDAVLALVQRAVAGEDVDTELAPPRDLRRPELLGEVYEAVLGRDERRRRGAFYTPATLATEVARATLGPLLDAGADPSTVRVCDPAVGGGALLLAAARVLIERGGEPAAVVGNMTGVDADPVAAGLAGTALGMLGGTPSIATGDALAGVAGAPFDAVVTNPPFLGQLRAATARSREDAARSAERFGEVAAGYADAAGLFLVLSVQLARAGGRIGIIVPEPLFATRDGAGARGAVGASTRLDRCWAVPTATFDAGVRARVMVLERDPWGASGEPWRRGEWAPLARADGDPPELPLHTCGVVASTATVTADFRDQFYGVAAATVDRAGGRAPQVVTSGSIDPAWLRWGTHPSRILRRRFLHPRVPLDRLPPAMAGWARARLVPKLLVATQTRVLEAVADEDGVLLPLVPVISVVPDDAAAVWHLLAVLLAPPVAALARRSCAGAALSADAIKLSARQVGALPLPAGRVAWDAGAAAAVAATEAGRAGDRERWRAALTELGAAMCAAYGVPAGPLVAWWTPRLPDRPAA